MFTTARFVGLITIIIIVLLTIKDVNGQELVSSDASCVALNKLIELIHTSEKTKLKDNQTKDIEIDFDYQVGVLAGWKNELLALGLTYENEIKRKRGLGFSPPIRLRHPFGPTTSKITGVQKGKSLIHKWHNEIIIELKTFIKQGIENYISDPNYVVSEKNYIEASPSLEAFFYLYRNLKLESDTLIQEPVLSPSSSPEK
jgi:hypothetical protein